MLELRTVCKIIVLFCFGCLLIVSPCPSLIYAASNVHSDDGVDSQRSVPDDSILFMIPRVKKADDSSILFMVPSIVSGIRFSPILFPDSGSNHLIQFKALTGEDVEVYVNKDSSGNILNINQVKYKVMDGGVARDVVGDFDSSGQISTFSIDGVGYIKFNYKSADINSNANSVIQDLELHLLDRATVILSDTADTVNHCPNILSNLQKPPVKPSVTKYGTLTLDSNVAFSTDTFLDYYVGPTSSYHYQAWAIGPSNTGRYVSTNSYQSVVQGQQSSQEYMQYCDQNLKLVVNAVQCFTDLRKPIDTVIDMIQKAILESSLDPDVAETALFFIKMVAKAKRVATWVSALISGLAQWDMQLIDSNCHKSYIEYSAGSSTVTAVAKGSFNGSVKSRNFDIFNDTSLPSLTIKKDMCSSGYYYYGYDDGQTVDVDMGVTSGTFTFTYDTYSIPDRMIVSHGNKVLFDTGCVGSMGSVPLSFDTNDGASKLITVAVQPNCSGTSGTAWEFSLSCPGSPDDNIKTEYNQLRSVKNREYENINARYK